MASGPSAGSNAVTGTPALMTRLATTASARRSFIDAPSAPRDGRRESRHGPRRANVRAGCCAEHTPVSTRADTEQRRCTRKPGGLPKLVASRGTVVAHTAVLRPRRDAAAGPGDGRRRWLKPLRALQLGRGRRAEPVVARHRG